MAPTSGAAQRRRVLDHGSEIVERVLLAHQLVDACCLDIVAQILGDEARADHYRQLGVDIAQRSGQIQPRHLRHVKSVTTMSNQCSV